MKKQAVLLALGILSVAPLALVAQTVEQAYVDSYQGRSGIPIPVEVQRPIVGLEYAGAAVDVKFTVDTSGRPRDIVAASPAEEDLVEEVVDAVSRWEFIPLRDANGHPKSSKVMLPVRIAKPQTR